MGDTRSQVPPELEDVVNQVGEFIEYWGFKNVHGRIWAHIYVAASPLDASDLMRLLGISKALVSMSISDLMEYDVIQVAGKSERSTVTYMANPNVVSVVTGVLRKRERRLLSRIASATKVLKDSKALANSKTTTVDLNKERVQQLHEMVLTAEETLDAVLSLSDVSLHDWQKFDETEPADKF